MVVAKHSPNVLIANHYAHMNRLFCLIHGLAFEKRYFLDMRKVTY